MSNNGKKQEVEATYEVMGVEHTNGGPEAVQDRITELRMMEQKDRAQRIKASQEAINEVLKKYNVVLDVFIQSPDGFTMPIRELHPGFKVVVDILPKG